MRALTLTALPLLAACTGEPLNLFTIEDDLELGAQLHEEIHANPDEYPILDAEMYPEAYAHLDRIAFDILDHADVAHRDELAWQFEIIDDDDTLNAFAAPGGYIWVYTGIIRFLEREDDFAGVLAHEIAHSAERHTTQQLTRVYGVSLLLDIVLGEEGTARDVSQIALGLGALGFSRTQETEADDLSVRYLCDTAYAADGAASFFEQIDDAGIPEFLSTHPSPEGRVEAIRALADDLGCDTSPNPDAQYEAFLDSLP